MGLRVWIGVRGFRVQEFEVSGPGDVRLRGYPKA